MIPDVSFMSKALTCACSQRCQMAVIIIRLRKGANGVVLVLTGNDSGLDSSGVASLNANQQ